MRGERQNTRKQLNRESQTCNEGRRGCPKTGAEGWLLHKGYIYSEMEARGQRGPYSGQTSLMPSLEAGTGLVRERSWKKPVYRGLGEGQELKAGLEGWAVARSCRRRNVAFQPKQ